jgi:hypothetical protein
VRISYFEEQESLSEMEGLLKVVGNPSGKFTNKKIR